MTKCRICDSEMNVSYEIPNLALEVSRVYKEYRIFNGVNVKLYGCPLCNHYQIDYINIDEYYDDYIMSVSYTNKINKLQGKQINNLVEFCLERENFLEIGCGDGAFLEKSTEWFLNSVGVEPSSVFYKICRERGLNVINGYFDNKFDLGYDFDCFSARQVLEHVCNPLEILNKLNKILKIGGVGLIEVPNAQKMISENRYYDLFSDHVNYYTPLSLSYLANVTGFEVISLNEAFNGDYLELYIRKGKSNENLLNKREEDIKYILGCFKKFNNVSAWGAGAKAQAVMTVVGNQLEFKHLFDMDKNKQDKYLVNSKTKISYPDIYKINENKLIVIFAVSYQDEIVKLLKEKYNYTGYILSLEGEAKLIKLE
ncbi:class I SAM-dependent methyltransferase [Clostridium sp. FP2]|uniref:class I SAM-dependent methyltransferase n=1 Tax=Clostridium sp. FP2 TaxID=2724481 RepID=UPI0013E94EC8|nr:class I SAM-dependent methyltransferase [Clostridium sp. FP2]MBZ9624566.1 class I SAM-dependent methyltransferase [Clostridium sp. FP2]